MKKLIVYWTLNEMSVHVSGKSWNKKYKQTPMRSDFDEWIHPAEAIDQILNEHGRKPVQHDPLKPATYTEHKFAEIVSWQYIDLQTLQKDPEEKYTQPTLIPYDEMLKCASKKP